MTAKQLSVFIENRQGRLGEVLAVLKKNDVNILSLSLADTTEYGLLRILVNKPEKGKEMLIAEGFSSIITEILVIKVPHTSGSLQNILHIEKTLILWYNVISEVKNLIQIVFYDVSK